MPFFGFRKYKIAMMLLLVQKRNHKTRRHSAYKIFYKGVPFTLRVVHIIFSFGSVACYLYKPCFILISNSNNFRFHLVQSDYAKR